MKNERSFRQEARLAKQRMKNGFWKECKESLDKNLEKARDSNTKSHTHVPLNRNK